MKKNGALGIEGGSRSGQQAKAGSDVHEHRERDDHDARPDDERCEGFGGEFAGVAFHNSMTGLSNHGGTLNQSVDAAAATALL